MTVSAIDLYVNRHRQPVIFAIQDDDPSFDPIGWALKKAKVNASLFNAACDRVYHNGYVGPISRDEWAEQDGRKPYYVSSALRIIAKVLEEVDDYRDEDGNVLADAHTIKGEIVYWYSTIYGQRYPSVRF